MIVGMGGFNPFGGRHSVDPEASAKIRQMMSGRKTTAQLNAEALAAAGIDASRIPLTVAGAEEKLRKILNDHSAVMMQFNGNSLGLSTVTMQDDDGVVSDLHSTPDLQRIYATYSGHLKSPSFQVTYADWGDLDVQPIHADTPDPDPLRHPAGTMLRVEREVISETGESAPEVRYVRVGGLSNDTEIVDLATLQPILNVEQWRVVEVVG